MKYLALILSTLWLSACAVTEWIVGNSPAIEGAAEAASGAGVAGETVAVGLTAIVGLAKWYEHKKNTKELIEVFQTAKSDLPPAAKEKLVGGLNVMSDKLKKVVSKVKKSIKEK